MKELVNSMIEGVLEDELEPTSEDISDFHLYYDYFDKLSIVDMSHRVNEQKLKNIEEIYLSLYRPPINNPSEGLSGFIKKIDFWLSVNNVKYHQNFQKIAITLYVQLLVDKQKCFSLKSINRRLYAYKLKTSERIEFLNGVLIEKNLKIKELCDDNDYLKKRVEFLEQELRTINNG